MICDSFLDDGTCAMNVATGEHHCTLRAEHDDVHECDCGVEW